MPRPEFVNDVGGVEARVLRELAGDDLKTLSEGADDQLHLAADGARVLAQEVEELHLDGAAATDHRVDVEGPSHDHDGVVDGALGLGDELLGAAAQDECGRLGDRTAGVRGGGRW